MTGSLIWSRVCWSPFVDKWFQGLLPFTCNDMPLRANLTMRVATTVLPYVEDLKDEMDMENIKKKTKMLERTIQPLFLLQQTVSSVQWATTVHKKSNMWTAKDSGRLGNLWERAKRRNTNINQQDGRRSRPLDYPVDRGDRKFLNNNNKKMTTYGIL